jgi:arylsulfatase A-like enzyme
MTTGCTSRSSKGCRARHAGLHVANTNRAIDIASSLLDWLGVAAPARFAGESIRPQ